MQYTLDLQVTMAIVQGHKPRPNPSLDSAERKLVWLICLGCWALTPTNRPSMKEILNRLTLDEDFIPQATNVDFELPSPSSQDYDCEDYDGPGSDEEEEIELERKSAEELEFLPHAFETIRISSLGLTETDINSMIEHLTSSSYSRSRKISEEVSDSSSRNLILKQDDSGKYHYDYESSQQTPPADFLEFKNNHAQHISNSPTISAEAHKGSREVVTQEPYEVSKPRTITSSCPQGECTRCSGCEMLLDSFRYVCSTCRETPYRVQDGLPETSLSLATPGFELCPSCMEHLGILHAAALANGIVKPDYAQTSQKQLAVWARKAPLNKELRHAFIEMVWGPGGWQDVERPSVNKCSTCSSELSDKQFICISCENYTLCTGCYSQVHEIHPRHAFVVLQDRPLEFEGIVSRVPEGDESDNESLAHPGVKCAHCLQRIIRALYHCVTCESWGESVNICSNCESVGLPGNLDAPDKGHSSAHIMIKIPFPMEPGELRAAGQRAIKLLYEPDTTNPWAPLNQPLIGRNSSGSVTALDHNVSCDSCRICILGTRFQCGACPSSSSSQYNLCEVCEEKSYLVHDPMHIFFKFPRPVDRQITSESGLLPDVYKEPVGQYMHSRAGSMRNPTEYLQYLRHNAAHCDRCDLCGACEKVDTHDRRHIFFVLKAPVDMNRFRKFADPDSPQMIAVLKRPVYFI
ncbi:hypothetical protein SCHPADRAFT_489279 [Schizopora paradoxa]|uniref:ZZ-type domain-containing protein n=1 Tax=Schizopora paradoxa TaxID=27342 RepID=A0A0H2RGN6_9AGAM|nr:hypothetical protein SCHPADRAFT_489279 [Schizopora paradoxa]